MIDFPQLSGAQASVVADLQQIDRRLKAESPADTVACAFGVGTDVHVWYDESHGRFFDLASLTKPLFTAPVVLEVLSARGSVDSPVDALVGWLGGIGPMTTLRRLLTHASGLPGELPPDGDTAAVRAWFVQQFGERSADTPHVLYSDANYWLLGDLVSDVAGQPLHALFAKAPTATVDGFCFGQVPSGRAVPTGPVIDAVQLVHDPAARRLGASGHAGAFGTLAGTVAAVLAWLDHTWLEGSVATAAVTCQTHTIPGGHRSLAWTLAGDPHHVVAHDWPPTTLCHTGFTGVSVAFDPVSRWWAVHLTNALPVERDATPVLKARRCFYAVAATQLRAFASRSTGE